MFTSAPLNMSIPADAYAFSHHHATATTMGFEPSLYADAPNYMLNNQASPSMYADDNEMRLTSSSLSTASIPSAPSSAIGSPESHHGQLSSMSEWSAHALGGQPGIVGNDYMVGGGEYSPFDSTTMDELAGFELATHSKAFVGEFFLFVLF